MEAESTARSAAEPGFECFDCADQDEEPEDEESFQLAQGLSQGFDALVADVGKARDARRERMAFRSAAEVADEMVNADKVVLNDDEKQQLGEWLPGDTFQGDVNMRTLDRLLKRVDQRGYERSAQQLEVTTPAPAPEEPRSRLRPSARSSTPPSRAPAAACSTAPTGRRASPTSWPSTAGRSATRRC